MIPFDKAKRVVLAAARPRGRERVPLEAACGRVLAQDVKSDVDMPPADMAAMDGFACRRSDLDMPLAVVDAIAAGDAPRRRIGKGQCSRIMTGAPVPSGADTVVMREHVEERGGVVRVRVKSGNPNIRYRAEDIKKGDIVLSRGTRMTPAEIAVLASVGCSRPWVAKIPRVGIIATGNELVEPDKRPAAAQIRNTNGWQLAAQVERAGCRPRYFGIAKDTPVAIGRILKRALAACDVVLLSGGVSAGDFDFVPCVLRKNGVRLLFEKIAIKPGKPTVFGIKGTRYFFGLPGNPVSTFVLFEVLVRPFLMRLMGCNEQQRVVALTLGESIRRKHADRLEFKPVRLDSDGRAYGIEYHGSAHIHAYTRAQGIVALPPGITEYAAGETVAMTMI